MYIGPWQEYRLAKIQDNAFQRLRKEWEDQLRAAIPEEPDNDARIRELMQPLVAKLPALLLAAKSRKSGEVSGSAVSSSRTLLESNSTNKTRRELYLHESVSRPKSAAHSIASSNSSREKSASNTVRRNPLCHKNGSNQETHEEADENEEQRLQADIAILKKKVKKKKKSQKAPLTALEQVQKRKQMFAKWVKQAGTDVPASPAPINRQPIPPSPPTQTAKNERQLEMTRLPAIYPETQHNAALAVPEESQISAPVDVYECRLPLLQHWQQQQHETDEWDFLRPYDPALSQAAADDEQDDLDKSLDEDEVNNLLKWTDTLLSPNALDSLAELEDDELQ